MSQEWHIVREGRQDLICLLKGHRLCIMSCKKFAQCATTYKAHCLRCNALVVHGSAIGSATLPVAKRENDLIDHFRKLC